MDLIGNCNRNHLGNDAFFGVFLDWRSPFATIIRDLPHTLFECLLESFSRFCAGFKVWNFPLVGFNHHRPIKSPNSVASTVLTFLTKSALFLHIKLKKRSPHKNDWKSWSSFFLDRIFPQSLQSVERAPVLQWEHEDECFVQIRIWTSEQGELLQ